MDQNQLLQALLRKTQAAVAAAGVAPGATATAGGSGYPFPYAGPPADGMLLIVFDRVSRIELK